MQLKRQKLNDVSMFDVMASEINFLQIQPETTNLVIRRAFRRYVEQRSLKMV